MKHNKHGWFLSVCAPALLILSVLLCGMGLSLMANEYSGDELKINLSAVESDKSYTLTLSMENRADYALHNVSYRFTLAEGLTAPSAEIAKDALQQRDRMGALV